MLDLLLCTGNPGKVDELRALLPPDVRLFSLTDKGLPLDLPEDADSLEGNALQKARFAYERTGMHCLADDTGLEVTALNGAPGVYSARYAGPAKLAEDNMAKLLQELAGAADRSARFRTVIAWVGPWGEQCYEGTVEGTIAERVHGAGGFGYDPIFRPLGGQCTFAELDPAAKNAISHRGRAVQRFLEDFAERCRQHA